MGPCVGSSSVLGGISAGPKLFLRGGAVLRGQAPPPTAAGHCPIKEGQQKFEQTLQQTPQIVINVRLCNLGSLQPYSGAVIDSAK